MTTAPTSAPPVTERREGAQSGALGLVSSPVVGVASTAPAYSLAATLGFVVAAIGLQAPAVTVIAFVPMLFIAYGYKELNNADPDCGTTFTWAVRAFAPRTGWLGGWAIVAADVLVMASLAQIAGQYVFLLFNADGIGSDPASGWVLLVGIGWIVAMTAICYVGIEISANFQKILLGIELTMLLVLSVWALVKVGNGTAPAGHLTPALSWFNPFAVPSASAFVNGVLLMLFIYWGGTRRCRSTRRPLTPTPCPAGPPYFRKGGAVATAFEVVAKAYALDLALRGVARSFPVEAHEVHQHEPECGSRQIGRLPEQAGQAGPGIFQCPVVEGNRKRHVDSAVGTSRNSNNAVRFGYAPGLNTINPISTGTR